MLSLLNVQYFPIEIDKPLLPEKIIDKKTRQHNTYLADSSSCVSEHMAESITHGPSSLSTSPWVPYTADLHKQIPSITVLSKAEDSPRPRRKHYDRDSGLSFIGVKITDDRFYEIKASSEVSFAIVLDTS